MVPCISVKLGKFVYWSFLVIMSKSTRISLNHFRDSVIQLLESGKTQKVASFPCLGRKNLWIYSWYSLPDLKYFFMKCSRNEGFAHFLVTFFERLPWLLQNFSTFKFWLCISKFMYKVLLPSNHRRKSYQ